mgnify:CR=1 FL=1
MTNWDDFQELFHKMNFEIDQTAKALERMRIAFESVAEAYQEFIDYCEKNTPKESE